MIAVHLAQEFKKAGLGVVGPALSVPKASALIEREGCDFAVLDIRLGLETSEPIAHILRARGIPFVVATGYSNEQLPAVFQYMPVLSKPVSVSRLLTELRRHLPAGRTAPCDKTG